MPRHERFHPRPTAAAATALLAVILLPPAGLAQSPDHAPLVLQLSASPAAQGLGGAFPLARPTGDILFAHPAALVDAAGIGASTQVYGEGATYASASGAREWWSGGVGAGVRTLSYTVPELTAGVDASLPGVPSEAELFDERARSVTELAASAGYARSVRGVDVGVAGTWVERRSRQDLDRTIVADLGLAADVGPGRLALTARSLGGDLDADDPDGGELPTALVAGYAVDREPVGPLDVGAAVELGRRADGEVIPAGGIEVAWWPIYGRTFVARVGFRRSPEARVDPWTLGGAFHGDDIGLVYAWRGVDGTDGIHRFGILWR